MDTTAKTRSQRKPKGEGHVRRGEILVAAEQIFVADGYEGATIRKIADAVGVSSTALYLHFRDKAEILSEICREAFEALHTRQAALISEHDDPMLRLRALLRCYADFGFHNVNAYRLAFMTYGAIGIDDEDSLTRKVGADLYQSFENGVDQALPSGTDKAKTRVLAQLLWASVRGLISIIIVKPYIDWGDREVLIETQLDLLLKGLASE